MEHTTDSICRGEVVLRQPRHGYRFNVDSVILAHFCAGAVAPPARAVDLGAGCGVVGLLLASRWPRCNVVLVEIQPELALLAQRNIVDNNMEDRVSHCCADLREPASWCTEPPGVIVCNPPYFKQGSGQLSQNRQLAVARHEVCCTLEELLAAGADVLPDMGSVGLILPAARRPELLRSMQPVGLGAKLIRAVRPLPDRQFTRILVLASRGRQGAPEEQPELLVEQRPGVYSEEMERILVGEVVAGGGD